MSTTNKGRYFLDGDGEMCKLIREKDWSKTSLGSPDTWSQSLRTTLGFILNSKFPMFLWWGAELNCFYNDAYRPSLGNNGKHSSILGQKGEEAWPEIWSIIHPLLQQVLDGKGATWSENQLIPFYRNGIIEDIYWTFSYSPVYDESGNIVGIMTICSETTETVILLKKLEESNKRYLNNIMQAPTAMCVLKGENHIVEIANEQMLRLLEKNTEEVLNKPIFEALHEAKNQGLEELIDAVFVTGEKIVANEKPVKLLRNGNPETIYVNFVFEAIRELDGTISGIIASALEVTSQVMARSKNEEINKRFRNTLRQAPVGITILRGSEYIVEMANEIYLKLVDREESSFVGKPLFDSLPEVKETVNSLLNSVLNTGIPYHGNEVPIPLSRNGKINIFYFDFLYHPLKEEDGKVSGIIVTATEVTEKVEARKKIYQNQERLNIIVEASELGTWELNLKTREPNYSQRYLEIIGGYTDAIQLTHEQSIKHLHPEDIHIREKAFKKALLTGYLHYESRVVWIDQSIHWQEGKGKVFYDTEGKPEKMIGTIRDITEEKKHQHILEESEQKFRILANSMPQLVWTSDIEGNLNYFNQSVYDFSGLTLKQISNGGWIQMVHPDDIEENIKVWKNAIATGENFLLEHRFRRFDGEYRWQLSRAIPQIDENGKIQMWVGSSTDIQEQKTVANNLEKQVKEQTKEIGLINESLEKSEDRYHLMVEEIQDYAILYLNHLGIIENWNMGAQNIKGYKAEEIIGKNFSVFYTESDRKQNLPQTLLKQAAEKGKVRQEGWRVKKGGSVFWASVLITAIHNKKKELIGFSKVTHDLTDKKKAEDKLKLNALELQQKNIELEKMNKELESFAYISSHDLQEPLRKIQTFTSQLMEKESDNLSDSGKDKFKRMQKAAERMQALINDLLAYSKTNIQDIKFENTNLRLIIEEVKEDLKEELELKNAVIISDEVCDEINVAIIPFQFRQLLYNLLSNSIKFSKLDVPLEIKLKCIIDKGNIFNNDRLLAEKKYCHIQISDNGIGFEQEYGEKIFEVFQRLHGKNEYVGTGIGLAIVKKIVDNHKGIITATGELSKGATFNIYIPIV